MCFEDSKVLPDDGHVALVEVAKGAAGRASGPDLGVNKPTDIAAFLDRCLGDPRQWTAILSERGSIADHEHRVMIRNAQEGSDTDASGTIGRGFEKLQNR